VFGYIKSHIFCKIIIFLPIPLLFPPPSLWEGGGNEGISHPTFYSPPFPGGGLPFSLLPLLWRGRIKVGEALLFPIPLLTFPSPFPKGRGRI